MNKWIKLSEEIPDQKSYDVLVFSSQGLYKSLGMNKKIDVFHWYKTDFGDMDEDYFGEITHWMPLPNPPEDL